MLQLYVLYACVHFTSRNPPPRAGETQCIERQVYFHADACRSELPEGGGLTQKSRYALGWLECMAIKADSWIPAESNAPGSRLYQAEASVSDPPALFALLAPLSPEARATLGPGDLKRPFQKALQGPDDLSFFVVGTGTEVIVFAVTHLDDFQFAQVAADVSSSSEGIKTAKDLDFATIAEDAGVKLTHRTLLSHRPMPPPGGMEAEP